MADALILTANATQLGVLKSVPMGFDLASGDTLAGLSSPNWTVTVSDPALMSVTNVTLGSTEKEINYATYAASQWVSFDLTALAVPADGTAVEHILFAWVSTNGVKRTARVNVVVAASELITEILGTEAAKLGMVTAGEEGEGGGSATLTVSVLDSNDNALEPGRYVVDASGGPIGVVLTADAGEWVFYDPLGTTDTNNLTISSGTDTFNQQAGPFVYDGNSSAINMARATGATDLAVTVSGLVPISETDKAKLNNISVTQAVNLDTLEIDATASREKTDLISITQSVNLDTMESDVAALVADMARIESKEIIDPRDFGAITGDNVTEQQAINNADAVQAAIDAAYAAGGPTLSVGAGVAGNKLGASFNRRTTAEVRFEKIIRIAKPIWVKQQGCNINWSGYNGVIARYGPEDYFSTNWPGRWAFEIGDDLTENTTAFYVSIRGLTFTGFDRLMQLGYGPNNLNGGIMDFTDCAFKGPTLVGHPKTYGIRVFNRSSILSFNRCLWNMFTRGLEIQSVDRVFLNDCRCQIGNQIFDSDTPRPDGEAHFVFRHARVRVNGFIGNPPLRNAIKPVSEGGLLKDWDDNETLVKGAYRRIDGTAYRTKRDYVTPEALELEDLNPNSTDWETIPAEAQSIPNIDTQRYYWFKFEDVGGWEANTEYVKGDMIIQPYVAGSNPIYWQRLNYTANSGASWAADRANWQVLDAMWDWDAETAVAQNDVRRALDPVADPDTYKRYKFWLSNASRTTREDFDVTEKSNWTLIPPTGQTGTTYGDDPFTVYRRAGQPISAWHNLAITGESLTGAETGGLTPVYWNAPMMPRYTDGREPRKQHTGFYIVGNTLQTDRRYPHIDINPTKNIRLDSVLRPCVLLAQHPNYMIVKDNQWSTASDAVAIAYDPYLPTKPELLYNTEERRATQWDCQVTGNTQGSTGLIDNFHPDVHTPYQNTFRLYSADWAPVELTCPSLSPVWRSEALSLSSVAAWEANTTVQLGEYRRATDPDDATEKLFRSRFHRTIPLGTTFDTTEKTYWQIVTDMTISDASGTSFIAPVLNSASVYKFDNPVPCVISSFCRATPGKIWTVHFINNKATLQHVTGRMYLKGAVTPVTPTWGQTMTFTVINGQVWEIGRNF